MPNNNDPKDTLDETFALFFSDYEADDHKVETGDDGIQRHTVTDQDAYAARTTQEYQESAAADIAKVTAYEQHQIDQDER